MKEGRVRLEQAALERRLEEATSLLPICRSCGGIRTDEACREQVKRFVRSIAENDLQAGLCPDRTKGGQGAPKKGIERRSFGNGQRR